MGALDQLSLLPALARWGLPEPVASERLGGSNNASWRVKTSDGDYILRLYRNAGNLPHVRFEHYLLQQLRTVPLGFQVPVPLPSQSRRTLESVEMSGAPYPASLFAVIPGEHSWDWANAGRVWAVGEAVGELDSALARIEVPPGMETLPSHGDVERLHRSLPDPHASIAQLPIDSSLRDAFLSFLGGVLERVDQLYSALPQQIIHSDIDGSNLLFSGTQLSGILDFEFASPELRVMELANATMQMGSVPESEGLDLNVIRVLARGYRTRLMLTSEEIWAIPDVVRLRGAVSVIHRTERWKAGLSPIGAVESRVERILDLDRWLGSHDTALIAALTDS